MFWALILILYGNHSITYVGDFSSQKQCEAAGKQWDDSSGGTLFIHKHICLQVDRSPKPNSEDQ